MSANPRAAGPSAESSELVLLCLLELVGVIPFVGLCIVGAWDQGELGFGTLVLLLVTPRLLGAVRASLRGRRLASLRRHG